MAVFTALRNVPSAIRRNPVLIGLFGVLGLLQTPPVIAQAIDPIVTLIVSVVFMVVSLFVTPFIHAGIIAVADEALTGRTRLETFIDAGKRNYVSLLGAYLLLVGVFLALGIVTVIGFLVAGVSVGIAGAGESGGIFILIGVFVLIGLAFAGLVMFTQFYGQEIVLNDASAVASLKGSISLVRENLVSTLGYTLLVGIVGSVFGILVSIPSAVLQQTSQPSGEVGAAMPQLPPTAVVGMVVVYVVFTIIFGTLFGVYAVSFYNELRGSTASSDATTV